MESIELGRVVLAAVLCNFLLPNLGEARHHQKNYGALIGDLKTYGRSVKGQVYAVDDSWLFIKSFSYDATGANAFFWAGVSARPGHLGYIIPYPDNYDGPDPPVLQSHNNSNILVRMPQGKKIRDMKWLAVWDRRFTLNFGDVYIPENLEVPKLRVLPEFSRLAHGLSSGNISILDSKTFYIPNLHYDGAGPDAYFIVGNGPEPNSHGIKVPNEMGSLQKLRGYQGEDIEIVLPGNLTVYDIEWLGVWCVQYKQNFGHVVIPKNLNVPPALGQTKITTLIPPVAPPPKKLKLTNCKEMLDGRVQVQWEAIGDDVQIRLSGRVEDDHWVAFGLSGTEGQAKMSGSDIVVAAYITKSKKFIADDYYISHYSQCDGQNGVCPDERIGGRNDVILLNGRRKDGVTTVEYRRPMRTNEPLLDRMIPETETSVIAAIGPLNSLGEANSHGQFDKTTEDVRINFAGRNFHECTYSLYNMPERNISAAWPTFKLEGEKNFNVRIGPTGGSRGYSTITGKPSWGLAWYINDLLIPELTVERGETYTFVVEGGNDSTNSAKYHPFYITSSSEGGFGQKNESQQMAQKVFAGVAYDSQDYPYPTAAGRFCEWKHKSIDMSQESKTFESFFETLRLECDEGEPAKLVWTVPQDAPDLLYYQCFTHNNLGWKIHVVDAGYISQKGELNGAQSIVTSSWLTVTHCSMLFSILGLVLQFTFHR